MTSRITDIWFRTALPLAELARRLELRGVTDDVENVWEWMSGTLDGVPLNITRMHVPPAALAETRIFIPEGNEFPAALLDQLIGRLRTIIAGPVVCGRWEHRTGNEFDLIIVKEFKAARRSNGSER